MRHSMDAGLGNADNFTFLKSRWCAIAGLCNILLSTSGFGG